MDVLGVSLKFKLTIVIGDWFQSVLELMLSGMIWSACVQALGSREYNGVIAKTKRLVS